MSGASSTKWAIPIMVILRSLPGPRRVEGSVGTFAAPFDNTTTPAGFNGSIPWNGLPLMITIGVDAVSWRSREGL